MQLVYSTLFSVLVNGVPFGTIKPSRRIHQGDFLYPFLFIIMAAGLGRSISALRDNNEIRGPSLNPWAGKQTHQQFVDDTMLMGHPLVQEAGHFK